MNEGIKLIKENWKLYEKDCVKYTESSAFVQVWSAVEIRLACSRNSFYTRGG
jgi:hypothetical protein